MKYINNNTISTYKIHEGFLGFKNEGNSYSQCFMSKSSLRVLFSFFNYFHFVPVCSFLVLSLRETIQLKISQLEISFSEIQLAVQSQFLSTLSSKLKSYSKPRATSRTNEGITFKNIHLSLWMCLPKSSWARTWSVNSYVMVLKGGTFQRWIGSEDVMRMPPMIISVVLLEKKRIKIINSYFVDLYFSPWSSTAMKLSPNIYTLIMN